MSTRTARWVDTLRLLGACEDAVQWAIQYPSLAAAWAACEHGDWMLWYVGKTAPGNALESSDDRKRLVRVACQCARLALVYADE